MPAAPRLVRGSPSKRPFPFLSRDCRRPRGLALQAAVRRAADDLAERFPESEGFRSKTVEFPQWASQQDFGAEIRFRRGVAAGFDVRVSVSPKDRQNVAVSVTRSAGSSGC